MNEYHKIQTMFKRDEKTKHIIEGDWTLPEFEYLQNNEWVLTEKVKEESRASVKSNIKDTLQQLSESFDEFATKKELKASEESLLSTTAEKIESLAEDVRKIGSTTQKIEVYRDEKKVGEVEGLKHSLLPNLIKLVAAGVPVMLVGPAGSGKTQSAEQVAEALSMDFSAISVGMQTSKSDLFGFIHAGGNYVSSLFRDRYEKGGLFLIDEIDAGNSNVILLLNSAIANGYCAFPDAMVKRHPDFRIIASANTVGGGADGIYVGRQQLDFATVDRFAVLKWGYCLLLEKAKVSSPELHNMAFAIRECIKSYTMPCVFSTRTIAAIDQLMRSGHTFEEALNISFLDKIADEDSKKILKAIAAQPKPTIGQEEPLIPGAVVEIDPKEKVIPVLEKKTRKKRSAPKAWDEILF